MHSDDGDEPELHAPGLLPAICAGIALAIAISLIPGTDLPGSGLQWSTEYHEQ